MNAKATSDRGKGDSKAAWQRNVESLVRLWKEKQADWRDVAQFIEDWEGGRPPKEWRAKKSPTALDVGPDAAIPVGLNRVIDELSKALGLQKSNLWRFRKALVAARKLWGASVIRSARDIPEHVSPESIELVEKIARAAPSELVEPISKSLFENRITRSRLRSIWQQIRHVVKVEGRKAPTYSSLPQLDELRRQKLFEELCLEAIQKGFPQPDGEGRILASMLLQHQAGEHPVPDIAVITADDEGEVRYHGIEVKTELGSRGGLGRLREMSRYFDYVWVVVPEGTPVPDGRIPDGVGILEYRVDGSVVARRMAYFKPATCLELVARKVVPVALGWSENDC